ncbi:hypothetical protein cypCar_00024325 [Cyprinus carpio]|nr:hypothetical protein cypCar_00024325 [Cyprinus carpio]
MSLYVSIRRDVRKFKETKKQFDKVREDMEIAQINVLQAKKKFEILDSMLSFMQAQYSLFQQGFNLLDEIDPYMKKLAAEVR